VGRAHLALYRSGMDTIEIDEAQMDSRLVLTFSLAGVLALTACTGQQATTAASSKAGGPKIELASTTPDPCPPARCAVSVLVKNDQGQAIENADVRYEARHTGMGHGGASATADNRGGGRYEGSVNFSMAGDWSLGVNVRLPGNNTVYAETIKLGVK
jgi:hypothetical protein